MMRLLSRLIIVACFVFVLASCHEVDLDLTRKSGEIEDKVAEAMDELEVLRPEEDESASQSSNELESDEQDSGAINGITNGELEAPETDEERQDSGPKSSEQDLIELAQVNKFSFLSLFHGRYYESLYNRINNYLVDKLEEIDNSVDNMAVALSWLSSLEQSPMKDGNLIRALRQFTALTKIGGDNRCSKYAYAILRKNDLATQGRGHRRRSKLGAMRRVDKIVYQYSIQHAIDCFHEYPSKFATKRAQMNQTLLAYVEPLFDGIFQTILRPTKVLGIFANSNINKDIDPRELVKDINDLDRSDVGEATLEKLKTYLKDSPDRKYLGYINDDRSGKYIIRDDKVKDIFERFVVKPCEYYIEQLGFDVLIPMRFDLQMLEPDDRYVFDSDHLVEFYLGYARFRACNLLVFNDQRRALGRHIVKAVHRQSSVPKI